MTKYRMALVVSAAAIAVLGTTAGATVQAEEAEPFECPSEVCLFENSDGTGATKAFDIRWAGGYLLESSGWAFRASSMTNNLGGTIWLYTIRHEGTARECVTLRDTFGAYEKRAVAPEADKNFNMFANQEYSETPPCREPVTVPFPPLTPRPLEPAAP